LFSTLPLLLLSINWNKSVKFYYCQYPKNISTSQHPFHTLVSSICHTIWCPCLSLGGFSMIYSCNYFLVLLTVVVPKIINSIWHSAFSIQQFLNRLLHTYDLPGTASKPFTHVLGVHSTHFNHWSLLNGMGTLYFMYNQ